MITDGPFDDPPRSNAPCTGARWINAGMDLGTFSTRVQGTLTNLLRTARSLIIDPDTPHLSIRIGSTDYRTPARREMVRIKQHIRQDKTTPLHNFCSFNIKTFLQNV